jgi:sensor histidine kinase YesM
VPPLLLQPLVENAIRHGLEPQIAGGRITVRAEAQGDHLRLTVRDTGVGLAEAATPSDGGGYGTRHVADRLTTLYGTQARYCLQAAPDGDGGTLAEVLLPLSTEPPAT